MDESIQQMELVMKRSLLHVVSALLALTLLASCGGPETPTVEFPRLPESLSVMAGDRQLEVSWAYGAPGPATSTDVALVEIGSDEAGSWADGASAPISSAPVLIDGLANFVPVLVRIAVSNPAGTSEWMTTGESFVPVPEPSVGLPGSPEEPPSNGDVQSQENGVPLAPEVSTRVDGISVSFDDGTGAFFGLPVVDLEARTGIPSWPTGEEVSIRASGFARGTVVEVLLFEGPQRLAFVDVSDDGTVEATIVLPAGVTPGDHALQLRGVRASGAVRAITLGFHVPNVIIDPPEYELPVGDSVDFDASLAGASDLSSAILWSSDNESVAVVDGHGVASGVSVGVATIRAVAAADPLKFDTVDVTVVAPSTPSVDSVSIDQTDPQAVLVADTLTLTATVTAVGGASESVSWSSNNDSVATVTTDTGIVTGVAEGTATITATSDFNGSASDSITVNVSSVPAVSSISIDQTDPQAVLVADTLTLTATVMAEGGASESVSWSSSNESVASVASDTGVVTGVAEGSVTITATSDFDTNITSSITVQVAVAGADPATSTISVDSASMTTDESVTVTVQLKDASGNNLTTGGATVTLSTTLGSLSDVVDHDDGSYTATLTSASTGTAIISGAVEAEAIGSSDPQVVVVWSLVGVSAENDQSFAFDGRSGAYAWGGNFDGQLGDGTSSNRPEPTSLSLPGDAVPRLVEAGVYFTLAVGSDDVLYAWGRNSSGQLGNGSTVDSLLPVSVLLPSNIAPETVAAGQSHALAVGIDGVLYAWGANGVGQLGNGEVNGLGEATPLTIRLPDGTSPVVAEAGRAHSMAISAGGHLYSWGYNAWGQLGIGNTTNVYRPTLVEMPVGVSATALAASNSQGRPDHSLAIGSDGRIYAWGNNDVGQLGDGSTTSRTRPVAVSLPDGASAIAIASGGEHSLAISSDGRLYAWGRNSYGQLGDGTTTDRSSPTAVTLPADVIPKAIAAGRYHSVALGSDGRVYSWGLNGSGQLGLGSTGAPEPSPRLVAIP